MLNIIHDVGVMVVIDKVLIKVKTWRYKHIVQHCSTWIEDYNHGDDGSAEVTKTLGKIAWNDAYYGEEEVTRVSYNQVEYIYIRSSPADRH